MSAPRRQRTGPIAPIVAVLALVATVGCGIPMDEEARVSPAEEVPFDLLETTTTTRPPDGGPGGDANICLSLDGSLLMVSREDRALVELTELVTAAPTEGEADLGLRSAVEDDDVTGVTASGGLASVELSEDFGELPGDQQLLALAQITCTLTAHPEVSRVTFLLDGEVIEVPVQGGSLVDRPVTRADYRRFIAN